MSNKKNSSSKKFNELPITKLIEYNELYKASRLDVEKLATKYGVKTDSIRRYLNGVEKDLRRYGMAIAQSIEFPEIPPLVIEQPIVIEADDAIIISDLEIPDVDAGTLYRALYLGIAHNIKTLILAGDIVATDQPTLKHWEQTWAGAENRSSYEQDIHIVNAMLLEFAKWFENIYFFEGNHDRRINKVSGGEIHLAMFFEKVAGLKTSRYANMFVKTSDRGYINFMHQKNYAANSVGLAQMLYNVTLSPTEEKCHIVIAHTHHLQSGWSPDGHKEVHALGCARNLNLTLYKNLTPTKHHQWVNGLMMLRKQSFYNLSKKGTDWQFWLGDYYDFLEQKEFELEPAS